MQESLATLDELDLESEEPETKPIAYVKPQAPTALNVDFSTFKTKQAFGALLVPHFPFGTWEHPWYGEMVFDEAVAKTAIANFELGVCAYDPGLFVGHVNIGARPAVGFLEKMLIHDNCLWGLYAAVDEKTYMAVKRQQYRYSSMEIDMNYHNPRTRKDYGPTIVGCALTNEPFLTEMPDVRAFSLGREESNRRSFSVMLGSDLAIEIPTIEVPELPEVFSKPIDMPEENQTPVAVTPEPTPEPVLATLPQASLTQSLSSTSTIEVTIKALAAELAEVKAENKELKNKMLSITDEHDKLVEQQKRERQERRLSIVSQAALSVGAKTAFETALKAPGLGEEAADELIAQVKALSVEEERTYLQQHGTETPAADSAPVATSPEPTKQFAYAKYLEQCQAKQATLSRK
jgi:hypothetical protein